MPIYIFLCYLLFYPLTALGIATEGTLSSESVTVHSVNSTSLQWVTLGHQKEVVLTTLGMTAKGPIYLRLKYPDTPEWNRLLHQCKQSLDNLIGHVALDIGPVQFQGHTLTQQMAEGKKTLSSWRDWYENQSRGFISMDKRPLCLLKYQKKDSVN